MNKELPEELPEIFFFFCISQVVLKKLLRITEISKHQDFQCEKKRWMLKIHKVKWKKK
jgi:hypothetical protein